MLQTILLPINTVEHLKKTQNVWNVIRRMATNERADFQAVPLQVRGQIEAATQIFYSN